MLLSTRVLKPINLLTNLGPVQKLKEVGQYELAFIDLILFPRLSRTEVVAQVMKLIILSRLLVVDLTVLETCSG